MNLMAGLHIAVATLLTFACGGKVAATASSGDDSNNSGTASTNAQGGDASASGGIRAAVSGLGGTLASSGGASGTNNERSTVALA